MNSTTEIQRVRVNRNVWKTSLTKEIINLEDNLDQLYHSVNLKPHRVVQEDENDDGTVVNNQKGIQMHELGNFKTIINEQVAEIDRAAKNICALISSVTEFDLPIPALVLVRLAARISSIRCSDFSKKIPGSLARRYIYSTCSIELAKIGLNMFKWISTILGTNILPFQAFINFNLLSLLEWTRTSNLLKHDEREYFTIRSQALNNITQAVEQLSLNINFDPKQVKALIEIELVDSLAAHLSADNSMLAAAASPASRHAAKMTSASIDDDTDTSAETCLESLKDDYACRALVCLDRLFIVYADYLDAQLELKLKNHVIQTCIRIYRDFGNNVIGLACRQQLLRLLETIASRPFATSTTELAWHVFELADKMETDPEIRYLARRSIKLGLAHRPIVVSSFEVYNCYANKLTTFANHDEDVSKLTSTATSDSTAHNVAAEVAASEIESETHDTVEHAGSNERAATDAPSEDGSVAEVEIVAEVLPSQPTNETNAMDAINDNIASRGVTEVGTHDEKSGVGEESEEEQEQVKEKSGEQSATNNEPECIEMQIDKHKAEIENDVDDQVQSYLSLFVDKPAS